MSEYCRIHRVPRAGIDPIDDELTALALLSAVVEIPLEPEIIVVALDANRTGRSIVVVDNAIAPDAVLEVAESLVDACAGHDTRGAREILLASVRPGGSLDDGDADRWLELCDLLASAGAQLLEWFVITEDQVVCPRDLLAIPPRWGLRSAS